jgi:hypothetical protein
VQVRVAPRSWGGNAGPAWYKERRGKCKRDSYHGLLVPLGATKFCEKAVDGVDDCVGRFNELDFALIGETTASIWMMRECTTCAVAITGVEPNANLRSWAESSDRGKVVSSSAPASDISVSVMG